MARVEVVKTEPRCTICASSQADALNAWLVRWKRGERDGSERITLPYLLDRVIPVLLGRRLSDSSVKRHIAGHVRIVRDEPAAGGKADVEADEGVRAALDNLRDAESVGPDDALNFVIALGVKELRRKLARGEAGVTVDQMIRAVDAKSRRGQHEAQAELLKALGGGIELAFKRTLGSGAAEPAGELIEGEAVEVQGIEAT